MRIEPWFFWAIRVFFLSLGLFFLVTMMFVMLLLTFFFCVIAANKMAGTGPSYNRARRNA